MCMYANRQFQNFSIQRSGAISLLAVLQAPLRVYALFDVLFRIL